MDPGSAHNGSCRIHHPFAVLVVEFNLAKYDCLLSDAAAHNNGIAANPLGVNRTLWLPLAASSCALSVDVALLEVPYTRSCRSASRMYAFMACDCDRPRFVRHAFSLAFSAGESVFFAGFVFGASDDTACLCSA